MLTYFNMENVNPVDFWGKVLALRKDDSLLKPVLLLVQIWLYTSFSNASLERLFSQDHCKKQAEKVKFEQCITHLIK